MHRTLSAIALFSALVLPAAAHADTVSNFDLHGNDLTLSFSLPTSPTPDGHDPHSDFFLGNIAFVEDGLDMTATDVYFYNKPNGGGFTLTDVAGNTLDGLDFYGPKLFTGSVKNPTFKEGKFTLTGGPGCQITDAAASASDSSSNSCSYKLNIAETPASATPEPSSLLLLSSGALATVGVLRRRFQR